MLVVSLQDLNVFKWWRSFQLKVCQIFSGVSFSLGTKQTLFYQTRLEYFFSSAANWLTSDLSIKLLVLRIYLRIAWMDISPYTENILVVGFTVLCIVIFYHWVFRLQPPKAVDHTAQTANTNSLQLLGCNLYSVH